MIHICNPTDQNEHNITYLFRCFFIISNILVRIARIMDTLYTFKLIDMCVDVSIGIFMYMCMFRSSLFPSVICVKSLFA